LPATPEGLRTRADDLYRNAEWAEAGKHYQSLARRCPHDVEIWRKWRECARKQNHNVLANLILGDALRIHPEWKTTLEEPVTGSIAAAAVVCR
jgi:hypothetical protein